MTAPAPNPATDPDVRRRVQVALDNVCRTAADLLRRHTDSYGAYEPPHEVTLGDVHGLIGSGRLHVLDRLDGAIRLARREVEQVNNEVDAWQRARLGPAWQPVTAEETP